METPEPLQSENSRVTKAAGVVGFYTLLSRILGLVRDMVVAAFFGTGMAADAFIVAFRIPNLLRRLFAEGSLTISFIPVFSEYLATRSRKEALDLAGTVLTLLALILALITLLGVMCAPWIVRLQAFGFGGSGEKYALTVLLTRITFPYVFFICLVAFFMGVLNSLRRFAAPAAAPIFLNIGIIGSAYVISPLLEEPVVALALGVLIGGFLQVALQIPWALREGLSLMPRWNLQHPALKRIGLLMLPAVFGSAVYQVNQFVGTLLASFLAEGSVSWLYFADRLVQFPLGVFAIALGTAVLPSFSAQAAVNDMEAFCKTLSHALRLVFFISLPAMAGLLVLGEPIIAILLERGAYGVHSTRMTNDALFFYSTGLWAFSGIRITVPAFYALQDTKTPVKIAVAALAVNLLFSLLLMGPLAHGGLALALSLASAFHFGLLGVFISRKVGTGYIREVAVSICKSLLAAAGMGLCVFVLGSGWLSIARDMALWTRGLYLGVLILTGIAVYLVFARIMGCRELKELVEILLFKAGKRKSGR